MPSLFEEIESYDTEISPTLGKAASKPVTSLLGEIESYEQPEPEGNPGILKTVGKGLAHGALSLEESIGTGIEYLGQRTGSEVLQKTGQIHKERFGKEAEKFKPSGEIYGKNVWDNPEILKNSEFWLYNVADMVPALAASIIPGAGAYKGLTLLKAAPKLAKLGGAIVGGFAGGALEGTQTYNAVLQRGGTEEEAARSSELMTLTSGILNALSVGKVLSKAGTDFKGKVVKHLGAAAWEGITEGLEEPGEVFSKYFGSYLAGEPLPTDLKEQLIDSAKSALTVAPIAAVAGGGSSVLTGGLPENIQVHKDALDSGEMAEALKTGAVSHEEVLISAEEAQENASYIADEMRKVVQNDAVEKAVSAEPGPERQVHLDNLIAVNATIAETKKIADQLEQDLKDAQAEIKDFQTEDVKPEITPAGEEILQRQAEEAAVSDSVGKGEFVPPETAIRYPDIIAPEDIIEKPGEKIVHTMPDGSTMEGPIHEGAVPGSEKTIEEPESIVTEFNKAVQGADLEYEGLSKTGHQFTPQGTEFHGRTFTIPELSTENAIEKFKEITKWDGKRPLGPTPASKKLSTDEANKAALEKAKANAEKTEVADLLTEKLDAMQQEVNSTRTRGVTQEKVGQPGETIGFPADSPRWMQELPKDKNGRIYSRARLNAVFNNVKNGKKLTDRQETLFDHIKTAAENYTGDRGEFIIQEEATSLEKRGFDLLGGREVAAGNLEKGDTIVGTVEGVKDEYTVTDTDDNGQVVLKDGVTKKVDVFDDVTVEGIKKAKVSKKPIKEAQSPLFKEEAKEQEKKGQRDIFTGDVKASKKKKKRVQKETVAGPVEQEGELDLGKDFRQEKDGQSTIFPSQIPTKADEKEIDIKTIESFNSIEKNIVKGDITPEQLKAGFESVVKNKDQIMAELSKMPKSSKKKGVKTLLGMLGGMARFRYKSENKASVVKAVYQGITDTFNLSSSLSYDPFTKDAYINALRKKVENTTQDDIDKYAATVKKNTEEFISERKKIIEGVSDPQTLEDFKNFFQYAKDKTLTPDQQERYDTLKSDSLNEKQKDELERKSTLKAVDTDTDFKIIEGVHTKKGTEIFTVTMSDRVDRETFVDLRKKAKQIGGYYSRYRGGGAIPGFVFTEKAQAEKFVSLKEGDVSVKEEITEKTSGKNRLSILRLKKMADKAEAKGKEKLNQDRLTNTSKRAGQAASAEADARATIAFAKTLRNIAEGIEQGKIKYLSGIKNQTQLNTLFRMLIEARNTANSKKDLDKLSYDEREGIRKRDPEHSDIIHASLPKLSSSANIFNSFLNDIVERKVPGTKLLVKRYRQLALGDVQIDFSNFKREKDLRLLLKKAKDYNKKRRANQREVYLPWYIDEQLANRDRLARMGIETDEQVRSALRELSSLEVQTEKEDPIKVAERNLVGKKPGVDFFPTPKTIANTLVDRAGIEKGDTVLEPSAGKGDIADAIKDSHPGNDLETVELSDSLREVLELKGHKVTGRDFLEHTGQYDKIIMNPPFSKGMDVDHVKHAYSLLKPGGKIVAIMGEHPFFANDKKSVDFREWISDKGFDEKLPEGSFKGKEAFRQTGVNSRIVEIEKSDSGSQIAQNIREAIGKTNTNVTSEDGRAYILEDLASGIYKVGMSVKEFSGKIADKLGNVYASVKDVVIKIYNAINAHLDTFTLGSDVGAIEIGKDKKTTAVEPEELKVVEKLHNTTNQTAEQDGEKYQGSAEKGQATIESIMSDLRKTSTTKSDVVRLSIDKEQKIIEEYRKLELLAKDSQASVASKQKMLVSLLRVLPANVRAKVITPLSAISRFKRIKTHEKRIDEALSRSEKELAIYLRRTIVSDIKKGVTKKKLAKNRIKKGTIGHEAERDLQFIREVLTEKDIASRMNKIENQIEQKEAALEEADETRTAIIEEQIVNLKSNLSIAATFGDIKSQKLEDLLLAKEALNSIILDGRAWWRAQQAAFKEVIEPMTDNVQQDISGQKVPTLETPAESTKRAVERETAWGKGKGTWDAVENSILSWEFLMNKLSKFSGDKTLQSYTTTEMGSVVQSATKQENILNIGTDDSIHSSAKRIFNAETDKELNEKFMTQEVKQAGQIFSYDKNGNKIDDFAISQMEAAYMYAVRKNPDSIPTFDKMGMTDQTFKEIETFIGPELKNWVDYNVDEYLQDFHFSVNEVYRQVYGTNLTKTPGYISWYRDVPGKVQDKGIAASPHETGAKGMSKGAFKERVKNTNPYRFMSFNDVLTRHVSEMNNFKAWAMPTKIINGVFNNRKTQRLITQNHSANMRTAIKSFQTDFTKSPLEMRGEMAWLDKLRGNITTAMTALNPTIFLKQLTSIPALAESIPAKEWIKHSTGFWANPLKAWRLLKDSKHWESRRTKGMERDIRTAQAVSGSQAVANVRNLKNRAMFLVKWGDSAAILVGGYPVYKYHFDKNVASMGRKKAHEFALGKFETAMDRTQQASGIKDQGKFQRSGSYAKLFSMFLTAPKQYTSQITAAIRQIHSDPKDGDAYKRLFIFGVMMPSLFQATASGLIGLIGGDEEDEKKFISSQIKAILQSPLNGIPIIRDLQKGVWESAMGEWYGTDVEYSPVTEAGQSLLNAVFHGAKLLSADDGLSDDKRSKHLKETINNLFETAGYAYGLPAETVRKMFMENWSDVVKGETDYPFRRGIGFSRFATNEQTSRFSKEKKRLKKIGEEFKKSEDKRSFLKENKTDLLKLKKIKKLQSRLNKIKKRINKLKALDANLRREKIIAKLEKKHLEIMKDYIEKNKN